MLPKNFHTAKYPNKEIIDLLSRTTLGTSGARYQHLDTPERIKNLDNPLYLYLQRANRVLGNITFCRRNENWYIRYFAFDAFYQSSGKAKTKNKRGRSLIKEQVDNFFKTTLNEGYEGKHIETFYAYIDPKNIRSKWMSENFGFETVAELVTQSYSRLTPKKSLELETNVSWAEVEDTINEHFKEHQFFFNTALREGAFYVLRNERNEIEALAKTRKVNWRIERLPGKFGGVLVSLLPKTPVLNRLINPEKYTFLTLDCLLVKNNDHNLLNNIFESLLAMENEKVILWWTDNKDSLYINAKKKIKWGILHTLIGTSQVDVVVRSKKLNRAKVTRPVYVFGGDLV